MSNVRPTNEPVAFSPAAIFGRVVESSGQLSPALAEHVLTLSVSEQDQSRIALLLEKNSAGKLTKEELTELDGFNHVADLLSLWKSRARRVLHAS